MNPLPRIIVLGSGFGVIQLWKASALCCGWCAIILYQPTVSYTTVVCQLMALVGVVKLIWNITCIVSEIALVTASFGNLVDRWS
ncbi:hypothetical protein SESBI_03182, partial [Sesbania bispinosa]